MRFLIFGIIGIVLTGILSFRARQARGTAGRVTPGLFWSGVPAWIPMLYVGWFACAVYGLTRLIEY